MERALVIEPNYVSTPPIQCASAGLPFVRRRCCADELPNSPGLSKRLDGPEDQKQYPDNYDHLAVRFPKTLGLGLRREIPD